MAIEDITPFFDNPQPEVDKEKFPQTAQGLERLQAILDERRAQREAMLAEENPALADMKNLILSSAQKPRPSGEIMDDILGEGRTPQMVLSEIRDTFGASGDEPPTGFLSGVGHGMAFGRLGEEPRGGWGQVGHMVGIGGNIILQTALLKKAFGLGTAASSMKRAAQEIGLGIAADLSYMKADPYEEDALTYGVMLGANIALPGIGALIHPGKNIPFKLLGGKILKESIEGDGKGATKSVIDALELEVVDEALPDAHINYPSGYPHSHETKLGWKPVKTQAEAEIRTINQHVSNAAREHQIEYDRWVEESGKIVKAKNKKAWVAGGAAMRKELRTFLKGKTLTDDQQRALLNKFDELETSTKGMIDEYNTALGDELWQPGVNGVKLKEWEAEVELLFDKLKGIEENRALGLKPTASIDERRAVLKQLGKAGQDYIDRLDKNPVLRQAIAGAKRGMQAFTKNPEDTAVSRAFVQSDEFQRDFIRSVAWLGRVEDPQLRREAALSVIEQIEKHADKIDKTIRQSVARALKSDPMGEKQALQIEETLLRGGELSPKEYDSLRPKLAKYILRELEEHLVVNQNDARLTLALRELDAKLLKAPDDASSAALRQERRAAIRQSLEQIMTNPKALQETVDEIGNKTLANAVDTYYASAGDVTSQARMILRRNQSPLETTSNIAAKRVHATGGGKSAGSGEPPHTPGGTKPDDIYNAPQNLNIIRRILGSLDVTIERGKKFAKSVEEKDFFQKAEKWLMDAFDARNNFLTELKEWNIKVLQPFYQYAKTLGAEGERQLYNVIDDIGRTADNMIDRGFSLEDIDRHIDDIIKGQSPEIQEGYRMFRQITDDLYININRTINKHNEMVKEGLIRGELIEPVQYRPGYVPFFYEGQYIVRIRNGDHVFTRTVQNRREGVRLLKDLNKGGEINGHVTLEPIFLEDVADAIQFTRPGHSIDDIFGIEASKLKELFDSNQVNQDNLHRIFWGNKLKRTLGADDARLETEKAISIAGRMSLRFKHYFPIAQEGNLIIQQAEKLGMHDFADAVKVYGDDLFGRSRNSEKIVEKYIRSAIETITETVPGSSNVLKAMGVSPQGRVTRGITNMLTTLGRMTALGFNPAAALVQWFIYPTNVAVVIGFRNAVKGLRLLGKVRNTPEFKALMQKAGLHINPANIGMAERMDLPKALTGKRQRFTNWLDFSSMFMFNGSENTIRASTLLGAREFGKDLIQNLTTRAPKTWQEEWLVDLAATLGKRIDSDEVLDAFAVKVMKRTNFDFDVTGLNELARNPLTKPFAQFKTYFFKEFEFLFFGGAPLTMKERFISLGMFSAIGGLFALPMADEMDQWSTAIFGVSPKLWVMDNLPEVVASGLPSAIGIDMSSKANAGSLTNAFAPEGWKGVFVSKLAQQMKSYSQGNIEALPAILGMSSAVRAAGQGAEFLTTGRITDKYGQTLADRNTMGTLGAIAQGLGIPSTGVSYAQQANRYLHVFNQRQSARDRRGIASYFDALESKNTDLARRIASQYGLTKQQIEAEKKKRGQSALDSIRSRQNRKVRERKQLQALEENL